jgi:hypothetical protein
MNQFLYLPRIIDFGYSLVNLIWTKDEILPKKLT